MNAYHALGAEWNLPHRPTVVIDGRNTDRLLELDRCRQYPGFLEIRVFDHIDIEGLIVQVDLGVSQDHITPNGNLGGFVIDLALILLVEGRRLDSFAIMRTRQQTYDVAILPIALLGD